MKVARPVVPERKAKKVSRCSWLDPCGVGSWPSASPDFAASRAARWRQKAAAASQEYGQTNKNRREQTWDAILELGFRYYRITRKPSCALRDGRACRIGGSTQMPKRT